MNCQYCERECENSNSYKQHSVRCKLNPNRIVVVRSPNAGTKKGRVPWNKGKTGVQSAWNKGMVGVKGTPHTDLVKKRLSEVAKTRNLGGYVEGSGRGKKGSYHGIFCDSSWELAYVIYCLEHNIDIQRNTEIRKYIWEGKERNYIPDFIVDFQLIEIKGYNSPQWEAKLNSNPDVKVLYKDDLKEVFRYVKEKYGKDFIKLYQ